MKMLLLNIWGNVKIRNHDHEYIDDDDDDNDDDGSENGNKNDHVDANYHDRLDN